MMIHREQRIHAFYAEKTSVQILELKEQDKVGKKSKAQAQLKKDI